jgi:hypothetical protein
MLFFAARKRRIHQTRGNKEVTQMKIIGAEIMVFCSLLIALSGCSASASTVNVLSAGVAKDINLISLTSGTVISSYQNVTSEVGINGVTVSFVDTNTGKQVVIVNAPVSITER